MRPLYNHRRPSIYGGSDENIWVADKDIGVSDENIGATDGNIGVSDENCVAYEKRGLR